MTASDTPQSTAPPPAGAEPWFASEAAARITRGVRRALADRAVRTLLEFSLANGRRADIFGLSESGEITIVEVKSCPADFLSDHKWQDYLEFCDRFYFAVDPDFPQELIPEEVGLMVADGFGAEVLREGTACAKLAPARRKAVTLRATLTACARLHRLEDPGRGM